MKTKAAIVALILLSLGLGIALVMSHNRAEFQKNEDFERIRYLSNQWTEASTKLSSQTEVNTSLAATLEAKTAEVTKTAQQLAEAKANLAKAESEAKAAQEQLEATKAEIAKRDAKITQLETQNLALDKQATELKAAIGGLETKIADTQQKLAKSEGDRDFLLKELKRMQTEKAELERQFNDLAVLREQVRKLKDELAIERRLEWLKRGLFGAGATRGGERLQQGFFPAGPKTNAPVGLNVEVRKDGAKILAPTNAPVRPPNK